MTDRVFRVSYDGQVAAEEVTRISELMFDLGYSAAENINSDLLVLVEGPTDKIVLDHFLQTMGISAKHDIKIWPMGGSNMNLLDLSVLKEKYDCVALIDRDDAEDRRAFHETCKQLAIPVTVLKKYSIENYLSKKALETIFAEKLRWPSKIDDKASLEKQLKLPVKKRMRAIVTLMTEKDIAGSDLADFLLSVDKHLTFRN